MSLLIVESPAKGRKIQKFLQGTGITVTSSFGHINNLDTEKLDEMISNNFTPIYKNSRDKAKVIKELKNLGKGKEGKRTFAFGVYSTPGTLAGMGAADSASAHSARPF